MAKGTAGEYDLEDRLLDYAARIIRLTDALPGTRAGRHVADQILRSGTAPLSNHGEAQAAESTKDFIHKLSIVLKELKESRRWLRLIVKAALIDETRRIEPLLEETEELIRIFVASIRTARRRKGKKSKDNSA
ncbi:MAG: four helix bundle protein [Kiritimatiellae bacterium]|nr:four helix bundle protein [Kiritimatiellia bacterium]